MWILLCEADSLLVNLEMRARTVSETEETQTATLLTCTVEQQPSCGWVDVDWWGSLEGGGDSSVR